MEELSDRGIDFIKQVGDVYDAKALCKVVDEERRRDYWQLASLPLGTTLYRRVTANEQRAFNFPSHYQFKCSLTSDGYLEGVYLAPEAEKS